MPLLKLHSYEGNACFQKCMHLFKVQEGDWPCISHYRLAPGADDFQGKALLTERCILVQSEQQRRMTAIRMLTTAQYVAVTACQGETIL